MIEFLEAIRDFTETGGQVLLVIGLLIFVMWLLILERAMYILVWHKNKKKEAVAQWQARAESSTPALPAGAKVDKTSARGQSALQFFHKRCKQEDEALGQKVRPVSLEFWQDVRQRWAAAPAHGSAG